MARRTIPMPTAALAEAERRRRMDAGTRIAGGSTCRPRWTVLQEGDDFDLAGRWSKDHQARPGKSSADPSVWGDVVLARRDVPASYHLAVTVDDALQRITTVIRGEDLFEATSVHRLLQFLLNLPAPVYRHHSLVRDKTGRKLSKSDGDIALADLRAKGLDPEDVIAMAGLDPAD
jgi:glutamyl-Q tRNA(Asp) synthetase